MSKYDLNLKVLDLLEQFEDKIDSLSTIPFSNRVVMDREELQDLINEINILLPEEYQHVKWLKEEKDLIIEDAHSKAQSIVQQAEIHENEILENVNTEKSRVLAELEDHVQKTVEDHEIVKKAKQRAQEIMDDANEQANQIKMSAYQYTDDILYKAGEYLSGMLDTIDRNREEVKGYRQHR